MNLSLAFGLVGACRLVRQINQSGAVLFFFAACRRVKSLLLLFFHRRAFGKE